jgi:hypothetical protein
VGGADGPVLIEGRCALDGGFVGAYTCEDVVCRTIRGEGTLVRAAAGGVVCAEVFDNVVLDERAGAPTVDRKVAVTNRCIVGGEGDCPERRRKVSVNIFRGCKRSYWADPGFHPFPATKLPALPDQTTVYVPPDPLV